MIKACNFYVSEWHLFAALLPYVRDELQKHHKVIIISQDNLERGMKELVKKLGLKFENEKGLEEVSWLGDEFEMEVISETDPVCIVVQGSYEFIEEINYYMEQKIIPCYEYLTIINCFEVYHTSSMLYNILDKHDYVFNTAGLNEKSEIFPGYIDKKKPLKEVVGSI